MKERWLPAAADGEALISIGITEPDAGWPSRTCGPRW